MVIQHGSQDAGGNELSEHPTQVDVCTQVTSKRHRHDLGGVGSGECLKDAPWDATKDLGNFQSLYVLGEEGDKDEANHSEQRDDHGLPVAITFGNDTICEKTDDLTHIGTV